MIKTTDLLGIGLICESLWILGVTTNSTIPFLNMVGITGGVIVIIAESIFLWQYFKK